MKKNLGFAQKKKKIGDLGWASQKMLFQLILSKTPKTYLQG